MLLESRIWKTYFYREVLPFESLSIYIYCCDVEKTNQYTERLLVMSKS